MAKLVGDHEGIVTLKFTPEALTNLIMTFNAAAIKSPDGATISLSWDEYEPGKATLIEHRTT